MEDILMKIYHALTDNKEIMQHVNQSDIKFYEYPNAQDIKSTCIIIDPLSTAQPTDYADNDNLTYEYLYQIDVFVKQTQGINGRLLCDRLIFLVQRTMWEVLGFSETATNKPEYISDFKLYRQAKHFEGKQYFN